MTTLRPDLAAAADIHEAVPENAARLAALHARCFDDPWQAELIACVLGSPGGFGFVLRESERTLGFALCRSAGGEGEVLTLCIDKAARRRGLGRALLGSILTEAKRRGLDSLFLEVAENNRIARQLYESYGFSPVGRRSAYYRLSDGSAVDALTLRCNLWSALDCR
jgi:ribosomal-protein-alanine N-acetyltransferase